VNSEVLQDLNRFVEKLDNLYTAVADLYGEIKWCDKVEPEPPAPDPEPPPLKPGDLIRLNRNGWPSDWAGKVGRVVLSSRRPEARGHHSAVVIDRAGMPVVVRLTPGTFVRQAPDEFEVGDQVFDHPDGPVGAVVQVSPVTKAYFPKGAERTYWLQHLAARPL
jgi:hypothetical protein